MQRLAVGERVRVFKAISPGLLPPLGMIFGLLVAFIAAQVWGDLDRAHTAVHREASALRSVAMLSASFPGAAPQLRGLVRQHIQRAESEEWPAIARGDATLTIIPESLAEAVQVTMSLPVQGEAQIAAHRAIVAALENALDARRQRILLSQSEVNQVKWICLLLEAICTLAAIAMVHCDNRRTAAIAMGLFATAMGVCILLITAHDRPFIRRVPPTALLQVQPDAAVESTGR